MTPDSKYVVMLTACATLGLLLSVPAAQALMGYGYATFTLILLQLLNLLLIFPLIKAGIALARGVFDREDVGVVIRSGLDREPPRWTSRLVVSVGMGLACGLVLRVALLSNLAAFPAPEAGVNQPGQWAIALSSVGAALSEEVGYRFGLVTLLAWLVNKVRSGGQLVTALHLSNLAAGLVFGLIHLPTAMSLFGTLSASVISLVVGLNAIAGVAFGWLFIRYGLPAAMIAHAVTNLSMKLGGASVAG